MNINDTTDTAERVSCQRCKEGCSIRVDDKGISRCHCSCHSTDTADRWECRCITEVHMKKCPLYRPTTDTSDLRQRFEENFTDGLKGHGLRVQFPTHSTIAMRTHVLSFFRQELLALAESVEGLKKYHKEFECAFGTHESFCENRECPNAPIEYNKALILTSALIRSKADELV